MNKFLIILAYYERPKIVLNALDSILKCSYENFEVAFIDDGSNFRGESVVRDYCASIIDKFKFYYINNTIEDKKNQGGSIHGKYMNEAIYNSDADYVMILCDDDAIHPDFLENFNTLLNNEGTNVKPYYYSNIILYDTLRETYIDGIKNNNLTHFTNKHSGPINCNSAVDSSQVVYSRKLFVENNLFYPFPQTKNLDAYIYQAMFDKWGPAYWTGLISQIKCWNEDNLGAKSGDSDYMTSEIKKKVMSKTLAVILHYNTPEMTDRLYEQLKPFENGEYDLVVLDNGSPEEGRSKYTNYRCEPNVYFGGGLNLAMGLVLENPQYDSLLFLNSDLIVHGYRFIKTLRKEMFEGGYKIISPAVIQPEKNQCFWPQMHNWNSNVVRDVPWIDFQCPLIHRDLIQEIQQFDEDLMFGWGNDVYSGFVCNEKGWKQGVVDYCSAVHLSNETVKQNVDNPIIKNYNVYAEQGMIKFFNKIGKIKELVDLRTKAQSYRYDG